jgi:hypothetical protein
VLADAMAIAIWWISAKVTENTVVIAIAMMKRMKILITSGELG